MTAPEAPRASWEIVPPDSSTYTQIHHGEQRQHWWLLDAGQPTSISAFGPGPLRIESRLLDPGEGKAHYVLEVEVDGECLDWHTNDTRTSGKATHAEHEVGRKRRITIDMEEGAHEVIVRLIAPADARCLVRIRQLERPIDED